VTFLRKESTLTLLCLTLVVLTSILTLPLDFNAAVITVQHVWYFGWITALSTGLGVVPLIFCPSLSSYYIGIANAIACGMMTAASVSLAYEGVCNRNERDTSDIPQYARTILGVLVGLLFIKLTKTFLDAHEDVSLSSLTGAVTDKAGAVAVKGASAKKLKKVLLILLVMTLHSFSEGVGIGVSFVGESGNTLGKFISASLAVHNIPEGLAVAIAMLSQNKTNLTVFLFCVGTSIPQPIMAVPAFIFVEHFIPFLPIGLGFAGGAMFYVAAFELWDEAIEEVKEWRTVAATALGSAAVMFWFQNMLRE
jgi:zinc transporter ZupT